MQFDKAISEADAIAKKIADSYSVTLVAHVLGPRGYDNTEQVNCAETEHFTVQEFNEVYQGIVNAGYFVGRVFFSEIEFIRDVLKAPEKYSSTIVFNLCRNGVGMNKKTVVPAICDLLGVMYTSSGAGQCALARNKRLFTSILVSNGIPCPASSLGNNDICLSLPSSSRVILKPNYESASQGVDEGSIIPLNEVRSGENYLVQQFIDGHECEVPIFCSNGHCFALPPVGICFGSNQNIGILSYADSKDNNYGFYAASDILNGNICERMIADAERAFELLGLEGYGRIDFRIDKNSYQHYIIDISTTPYITKHSSFAFAVELCGGEYTDIYKLIFAATFERHNLLLR